MKALFLTALVLSAHSASVRAAPASGDLDTVAPITITLSAESAPVGTEFSVPVTVGDLGGQTVLAYRIVVTYDPSVLAALDPSTSGTLTSSGWSTVANTGTAGELVVSAASATGLSGAGTLLNLRFEAVAVGESPLEFSEATFNEGDPQAAPANGSVTVTGAPPSTVSVEIGTTSTPVGSDVTVPVTIGDLGGETVLAYRIVVTYDPTVLTALAPSTSGTLTSSGWSTVSNTETAGELVVSAASAAGLSGAGTLLNLRFEAVAVGESPLEFSEVTLNEGDPGAVPTDGGVTVVSNTDAESGTGRVGFEIAPPHPNPTSESAAVTIWSDRAGEAAVRLFDAVGREVGAVQTVPLVPGGASAVELPTAGLPGGAYFVVVTARGKTRVTQLVVTR